MKKRKQAILAATKIMKKRRRPPEIPWKYVPDDFIEDNGSFLRKSIKRFIHYYEHSNERRCRYWWGQIYDESKLAMKNGFISREVRSDIVEYFRTI